MNEEKGARKKKKLKGVGEGCGEERGGGEGRKTQKKSKGVGKVARQREEEMIGIKYYEKKIALWLL